MAVQIVDDNSPPAQSVHGLHNLCCFLLGKVVQKHGAVNIIKCFPPKGQIQGIAPHHLDLGQMLNLALGPGTDKGIKVHPHDAHQAGVTQRPRLVTLYMML